MDEIAFSGKPPMYDKTSFSPFQTPRAAKISPTVFPNSSHSSRLLIVFHDVDTGISFPTHNAKDSRLLRAHPWPRDRFLAEPKVRSEWRKIRFLRVRSAGPVRNDGR